jgi:hypothetical protein
MSWHAVLSRFSFSLSPTFPTLLPKLDQLLELLEEQTGAVIRPFASFLPFLWIDWS